MGDNTTVAGQAGPLAAHVPSFLRRMLLRDGAPSAPREERVPAAVLFADISGFTRLSQQLVDRSPGGPEELRNILNRCFGGLVDLVHARGGEVAHFAGDAVFAVWPAARPEDLRQEVMRAALAALDVRSELDDVRITADFRLRLRLAISAGTTWMVSVGGVDGRWCFLTAGPPLVQIARAAVEANPGEVVLSPEARAIIGGDAEGEELSSGHFRMTSLKGGAEVRRQLASVPRTNFAPDDQRASVGAKTQTETQTQTQTQMADGEPVFASYLPRAVRDLIRAGQTEWLGEYRRVTTVFVNVGDVNDGDPDALSRLQRLATTLQNAVDHYGGSVNQLLMDDKGTTLVAAWGLSSHAHEDDAARAVQAALVIRRDLLRLGVACPVGISSGRIFAGTRGTRARLEYGLIGDSVNLAARLMAAAPDSILCDGATRTAARRTVIFETLPPVTVRGRIGAVPVYRPLGERQRSEPGVQTVIGRRDERAQLAAALTALEREGRGGLFLIEGQPGIGKSLLARDLMARTQSTSARGFMAVGDALERGSAYFAWREVFARLLDVQGNAAGGAQAARAIASLPDDLRARAGLLGNLLRIDLAGALPGTVTDAETADQMSPAGRADATRALAFALLKQAADHAPLLIVIEDAQWLDSASWSLLEAAHAGIDRLLLVLASRPMPEEEMAPEHRRLVDRPTTTRIRIEPLPREEALALACLRLQVEALPPEVALLIHEKAEGHPLFIEELVSALRDRGLIASHDGDCVLASGAALLDAIGVSNTVQGIITSRIDQLTPPQQLTLKVASVLGRRFSLPELEAIHPLRLAPVEIEEQLQVMLGLELVRRETSPSLVSEDYAFHHATIEEVAYDLLPLAQRRELHAVAAAWCEHARPGEAPSSLAVLAHHWTRAQAIPQALDVIERAAEHALRAGLFREAARFFGQALELAHAAPALASTGVGDPPVTPAVPVTPPPTPPLRLARWERQLSRAYFGLGQEAECRGYGEASVARLGQAVPASIARVFVRLATELLRQIVHGLVPRSLLRWRTAREAEIRAATRAFHALSYAYYLDQQGERLLHAVLRTANLAERLEPSGELARAYGALAYMAGAYGLGRAARRYQRRAARVAAHVGRPLVRADVLFISALSRIANGEWDKLRADMGEARAIFERLGERRSVLDVQLLENYAAYNSGDLGRAAAGYVELRAAAARAGASRSEYLAACWEVGTALRRGRLAESLAAIRSAAHLPRERGGELSLLGFLAVARWRQGDVELARQAADQAAALIATHTYTAPYSFEGYRDVAEVYLALWEKAGPGASASAVFERKARVACVALRRFSRGCRISQPAAYLQQGRCDWLSGSPRRALRQWRRALDLAIELQLPFEEGLARLELGRHQPVEGPARLSHLQAARDVFARIDAVYELAKTERP